MLGTALACVRSQHDQQLLGSRFDSPLLGEQKPRHPALPQTNLATRHDLALGRVRYRPGPCLPRIVERCGRTRRLFVVRTAAARLLFAVLMAAKHRHGHTCNLARRPPRFVMLSSLEKLNSTESGARRGSPQVARTPNCSVSAQQLAVIWA